MPKRAEKAVIDKEYLESVLAMPVHPMYAEMEPYLPSGGSAIELGCGVGNGTLWLADKGFHVLAIDISPEAVEILRGRLQGREDIDLRLASMQEIPFPKADVIVAAFSLFMLSPKDFKQVWSKAKRALKPGGIFMCQLLGPNDEWASYSLTHSRKEISQLLRGMDKLFFDEVEREGKTVKGEAKHWHVFHIIARKRIEPRHR